MYALPLDGALPPYDITGWPPLAIAVLTAAVAALAGFAIWFIINRKRRK